MSRSSVYGNGLQLSNNMRLKRPTRTLSWSDYVAYVMGPIDEIDLRPGLRNEGTQTRALWLQRTDNILPSIDREIYDFVDYIKPTQRDIAQRRDLIQRFSALIASFNPAYSIRPVGSYVTGLYLSTSDIDVVLTTSSTGSIFVLETILRRIRVSGFASKVEDILRARVPLIRITDKMTSIDIDLTASDAHGIRATAAVQKWLRGETEIKRMLIMVVKRFLALRGCGTTYTGGINSYVLVWMVVAWVEIEWRKLKTSASESKPAARHQQPVSDLAAALENLAIRATDDSDHHASSDISIPQYGRALRRFFEFYGTTFQYETQAIQIEPTPRFVLKNTNTTQTFLLSIYDPAGGSDMGSKAYGIKHIKATFRNAYEKMAIATRKEASDPNGKIAAYPDGVLYHILHT